MLVRSQVNTFGIILIYKLLSHNIELSIFHEMKWPNSQNTFLIKIQLNSLTRD